MKDSNLLNNLLNFDILQPDGIGIFLSLKLLYRTEKEFERMTGTDLYSKIIKSNNGYNIFLVGGKDYYADSIKNIYKESQFMISGLLDHLTNEDSDIEQINASMSDILFVALGTPLQEDWIAKNKEKINVPVIIAVGSGLDFLSGNKKRAPFWMCKIGLEWLYRLFQEPRRLWKRYIFGIPIFIFHIFVQKVKLMLKKV